MTKCKLDLNAKLFDTARLTSRRAGQSVKCFSCDSCGFGGIDIFARFYRREVDDNLYYCPKCNRKVLIMEEY